MTADTYSALSDALITLGDMGSIQAVVITGTGARAFCAGTDTAVLRDEASAARTKSEALRFFELLAHYPLPLVGALNGPAVGGGTMIASECDILLAVDHAFFSLPEVRLGLVGAASHAKQLFSISQVKRMALLGEQVTAKQAEQQGLLMVVEADSLIPQAVAVAREIASLDKHAVRETLAILDESESDASLKGYRAELSALTSLKH